MKTILAAWHFLKNKAVAIVLAAALYVIYWLLSLSGKPVVFAELLYTAILILSVTVLAPLMRLLVFPEVARYAESNHEGRGTRLEIDLCEWSIPPRLIHYWIATIICYVTTLVCLATLTH